MQIILESRFHYEARPNTTNINIILVKHSKKLVPINILFAEIFFK